MGPGRDQTRDLGISSQTRYRLCYAARQNGSVFPFSKALIQGATLKGNEFA